jgi:dTDP-4-dehydrorhamnose reductase
VRFVGSRRRVADARFELAVSRVVVTGAAGQLGTAIVRHFSGHAEVVALTRRELDLADTAAIERRLAADTPDVVINCAAFNDVDGAEERAMDAIAINAMVVRSLARACRALGSVLVHYGTDFVFDGLADRPYTEEDEPSPQSVYGCSKLLGDWFAADAPRHYVLRVESLFGGARRRSSIDRIAEALVKGEPARVFVDRTVTPSFVEDVSVATRSLLESEAPSGIYHCVNSGVTTWYELGEEIARLLGRKATLLPVKVADVTLRARRPQYAALSNDKLRRAGVAMPTWQDAVKRYLG